MLAFFIVPTIIKSKHKVKEAEEADESEALIKKLLAWIPKYSDL